jgi:hypothetical protein
MGKYSRRVQVQEVKEDPTHGCLWRMIGFMLILIVPALSLLLASLTINSSLAFYIPPQLLGYPILPEELFSTDGLATIFNPIANINNLYALLVIGALYTIILGSAISLVYAVLYRLVNPKRYGPMDAPPPKIKVKKYTR